MNTSLIQFVCTALSAVAAVASAFVAGVLAIQDTRRLKRKLEVQFDLFTEPRIGDSPSDKEGVILNAVNTGLVPVCVVQIGIRLRNGTTWLGDNKTCFLSPSEDMPQVISPGSELCLAIHWNGLNQELLDGMVFGFVRLATGETFFSEWINNPREYFSVRGYLNMRNYNDLRISARKAFGRRRIRQVRWESSLDSSSWAKKQS